MATQLWYYKFMGEEHGPVPTQQLAKLVRDGLVDRDSLVRRDGDTQWMPIEKFIAAFNRLQQTPTVSPQEQPSFPPSSPAPPPITAKPQLDFSIGMPTFRSLETLQALAIIGGILSALVAAFGVLSLLASGDSYGGGFLLLVWGIAGVGSGFTTAAVIHLAILLARQSYATMRASIECARLLTVMAEKSS